MTPIDAPTQYFHGTRADLRPGDLIEAGRTSNLTNKRFPGNPTRSYRTRDPLRVTGEVTGWKGHAPEQLQAMKDHLARLAELGVEAIED